MQIQQNIASFKTKIMKILGIIPARYGSTRFPGKALADILGKTMIQRVYTQASMAECLDRVVVATDDERIASSVHFVGGEAVMTHKDHLSGTDRCAEVLKKIGEAYDIVINIQGDEPFIQPKQIDLLGDFLTNNNSFDIATLAKEVTKEADIQNPNVVKVVFSNQHKALYFSRHAIPFLRNKDQTTTYFKHIGMYGYRVPILKKITQLPPTRLELTESLEQLRWLENDMEIGVITTTMEAIGIDTPEDLKKVLSMISS